MKTKLIVTAFDLIDCLVYILFLRILSLWLEDNTIFRAFDRAPQFDTLFHIREN